MKSIVTLAGVLAISLTMFVGGIAPAQAKRHMCIFSAIDMNGNSVDANATRKKKSSACKVAKRRCERRLKRKQRKNKFGRTTGCHEVGIASPR